MESSVRPDSRVILDLAQDAGCLDQRVQSNVRAQQVDLNEWLFNQADVPAALRVLELCCGTGSQTRYLLRHVRPGGEIVALDVSAEALAKLRAVVPPGNQAELNTIEGSLEELDEALIRQGFTAPRFDWIFCAYGLYYSKDIEKTLGALTRWLFSSGQLTIVGPFGPNNGALFKLLEGAGVTIPEFVKFTSDRFMLDAVLPYVTRCFETVRINTLINPIRWRSSEEVVNYWANTTFYDAARRPTVTQALAKHFERADSFINRKWVMRLDAARLRTDQI